MSNIVVKVVRKADNALIFWGAYPADEYSVSVTEEGQFRPEDLSEGLHEGVPTQVAGEQEGQGMRKRSKFNRAAYQRAYMREYMRKRRAK
jgi:hypothetical protein